MKVFPLFCLFIGLCLSGCDQPNTNHSDKPPAAPASSEAADLLRDVSGVWAASQGGLITIDYRDDELRLVIGDEPKYVKLGDIDVDQQTINLLLKRTSDNADIIWTLHRDWDRNKTSFHLILILDDGSQDELSFVRKVTADDINRLANLYSRTGPTADVAGSGSQLSPPAAAAPPAVPDSTSQAPSPNTEDDTPAGGTNGGAIYTKAQFEHWVSANSQFHPGHQNVDQDETQFLFYNHNGSIAKATITYPAEQSIENWAITYEVPRPGMSDAGAKPGDLIFAGRADPDTGKLSGTSYIFNSKCGKLPFEVHETDQQPATGSNMRVLIGSAPIVDTQTCQVLRYKEIGLDFEKLYSGIVIEKKQ